MCTSASDVFLGLLAVLLPPLPVWIKAGVCSGASLLNILLCVLGYVPGLLHSWYIIASRPDQSGTVYYYERVSPADLEAGRSRVPGPAGQAPAPEGYVAPPAQLGPRYEDVPAAAYGTVEGDAAQDSAGPSASTHEPASQGAPPSYDQAIRGDNKVQK